MISAFYILIKMSPYNYFVARGVFQVPMFTAEECETLLNISYRAAERNYRNALAAHQSGAEEDSNITTRGLLSEPMGWQKLRHQAYPTTDLNIVTDPFEKNDLEWIRSKLDARLAPTLERIYGLPASAIRANDVCIDEMKVNL
jgi:hypothetical protein